MPQNSFFTLEQYSSEIDLETNEDVLQRIYDDNVKPKDKLSIEFVFVTDSFEKAKNMQNSLASKFPDYSELTIIMGDEFYEITGVTQPITMEIGSINEWNRQMWDLGYDCDCKLDGWQVGT